MNKTVSMCLLGCLFALPAIAGADTSELYTLSGVPGLEEAASASESGEFADIINVFYKISIGLGSLLAVLIIVFEGVRYSASDAPGVKSELRGRMTMALGGLFLLIGAYMFIEIINPNITDLTVDTSNFEEIDNTDEEQETVPGGEVEAE